MPFLSLTKNSKKYGIQTFARAQRLPEPLKTVELEYLSVRDWYMQTIGVKAQYDEALLQAKAGGDRGTIKELGDKLHGLQCKLQDARDRSRSMGEKSYAEAFYFAATHMLPKETIRVLDEETEKLIGRSRHELSRGQG